MRAGSARFIAPSSRRKLGFEHMVQPVVAHREPISLYSEIGKLKMELDWLKKKSWIYLP